MLLIVNNILALFRIAFFFVFDGSFHVGFSGKLCTILRRKREWPVTGWLWELRRQNVINNIITIILATESTKRRLSTRIWVGSVGAVNSHKNSYFMDNVTFFKNNSKQLKNKN